jgi:hypothetical protein
MAVHIARRSPSMQDLLHESSSSAVVLVATALWVMLRQVSCLESSTWVYLLMPARLHWCLPDRGLHAILSLLSTFSTRLWPYVQVLQALHVIVSEALRTAQLVSLPLLSVAQVSSPMHPGRGFHEPLQAVARILHCPRC